MGFRLDGVVPWGRSLSEYREMFLLTDNELKMKIADFGGGPSSFNAELTLLGGDAASFDPIYQFSACQLRSRIYEVRKTVMEQIYENIDDYVWNRIESPDALERMRMTAMETFLNDFEAGRGEGRYAAHSLPDKLPFRDGHFDLGLSSHFLLMYTSLGYDFHISAINEMLRVCWEVRIFPLCSLDGSRSELTDRVISYFSERYQTRIIKTGYEFQRDANCLLSIRKPEQEE